MVLLPYFVVESYTVSGANSSGDAPKHLSHSCHCISYTARVARMQPRVDSVLSRERSHR